MNEAAAAGEEALARGAGGAMLYDASRLHHPDTSVFDWSHWQAQGALETTRGGRGTVAFVRAGPGPALGAAPLLPGRIHGPSLG